MFNSTSRVLEDIEQQASNVDLTSTLSQLRHLCLDEFGEVMLNMPDSNYPKVSQLLPRMASDEVQNNWTGSCGYTLLRQSLTFIRTIWHNYERITKRPLSEARILDYGCGYGRLLRLAMYFVDNERLFGCDPWDRSIELCKESGITCDLKITDYLPKTLPYEQASFDLIYSFSVFTHTSQRATTAALGALRDILKPDGLLVITVRPNEYWNIHQNLSDAERGALKDQHNARGFAFRPHSREQVDGDITYGDTSMTLEYISSNHNNWTIVGTERTLDDPYQRIVYLRRR